MEFRPCIDIHNGSVKQIVGSSLRDDGNMALENYVSAKPSSDYAALYKKDGLRGGHVIMLNSRDSSMYDASKQEALRALRAFPKGMQAGGGIKDDNAHEFLEAGASAVIVTSFVFSGGHLVEKNLDRMVRSVGKDSLVLDLSCRMRDGKYYIVTDRWQKFTDMELTEELLSQLSGSCSEFLIHACDVEGKQGGIDDELAGLLGRYAERDNSIPVTYAGGIRSEEDIEKLDNAGRGKVNFTIGSALDIFGGHMNYRILAEKFGKL